MIGKILFRLFGIEEPPHYDHVKRLSSRKPPAPPSSPEIEAQLSYMVEKHMLEGMSVFTDEGTLIASTYDPDEAEHEAALFMYIQDEFGDVPYAFFKRGDWIIFFRRNGRVYILRAPSYLSLAEIAAIGRDVERALFGVGF